MNTSHTTPSPRPSDTDVDRRMRRMTRRSFLWGTATIAVGYTGWRWLVTRSVDGGVGWPFRRALDINEHLARDYFSAARLAPTFPRSAVKAPRPNGDVGLSDEIDASTWQLQVVGLAGQTEPLALTLDAIKALPRVEMVTELKCIEGWSEVVQWAGARFADFLAKYPPETRTGAPATVNNLKDLPEYVSMETPDGVYYVGLDMASAIHPQTLLCYEMNGAPLTQEHGAPLRLVIPVKYGIKNIKRIGTIRFTNQRPADYWANEGYDWYAGH